MHRIWLPQFFLSKTKKYYHDIPIYKIASESYQNYETYDMPWSHEAKLDIID